jgi:SAM-dependent methyltransferase
VSGEFFHTLARRAAQRYPRGDRYARHFAYGKLTRDPVFRHLVEKGFFAPRSRILDLGCGQGLLGALLAEACAAHARGEWPAQWPAPPEGFALDGVDLAARDIERARSAGCGQAHFVRADIRSVEFGRTDAVALLDVLHYLDPEGQRDVIARTRASLDGGGVLLMRVADASRSLRFLLTLTADHAATRLRGHRPGRFHTRPLREWVRELAACGFETEAVPMSKGTGFANVLLVARRAQIQ